MNLAEQCKQSSHATRGMAAIAAAGFWYCIIPARQTWLLQPLDVSKRFLKDEFTESLGPPSAEPNVIRMIRIVAPPCLLPSSSSSSLPVYDSSPLSHGWRSTAKPTPSMPEHTLYSAWPYTLTPRLHTQRPTPSAFSRLHGPSSIRLLHQAIFLCIHTGMSEQPSIPPPCHGALNTDTHLREKG